MSEKVEYTYRRCFDSLHHDLGHVFSAMLGAVQFVAGAPSETTLRTRALSDIEYLISKGRHILDRSQFELPDAGPSRLRFVRRHSFASIRSAVEDAAKMFRRGITGEADINVVFSINVCDEIDLPVELHLLRFLITELLYISGDGLRPTEIALGTTTDNHLQLEVSYDSIWSHQTFDEFESRLSDLFDASGHGGSLDVVRRATDAICATFGGFVDQNSVRLHIRFSKLSDSDS